MLLLLPVLGWSQDCTADWSYRTKIEVDNTSGIDTLTDYQVRISVNTSALVSFGKMNASGSDIRFTDGDCCSQLCYWIEEGMNTTATIIWVKVPQILPGEVHPLFLYYGNSGATDAQDPECTFELFDTFDGIILNPGDWTTNSIFTSMGGSELRLRFPSGDGGLASTTTFTPTPTLTYAVSWRARSAINPTLGHFTTWGWSQGANPWNTRSGPFAWNGSTFYDYQNAAGGGCSFPGSVTEDNNYHTFSTILGQAFATDGNLAFWCGPLLTGMRPAVSTSSQGSDTYIDWVYVAKVATTPPNVTIGNEYDQFQVAISVLGNDTICTLDSVQLDAGGGYVAYEWSNGDTTQMTWASTAGFYTVTAYDSAGCGDADSVEIIVVGTPVDLGPDQMVCEGTPVVLDAGSLYASYVWSTGDTTQTLNITMSGTYSVTVTEANSCSYEDQATVTIYDNPVVDLGNDTTICGNDVLGLDAGSGYTAYMWSTGDTTPTITVDTTVLVSVMVTDSNTCSGSDTISVTETPDPTPDLGPDQVECDGYSISFDAGPTSGTYLWSTGDTSQTIGVTMAGVYSVTVTDGFGCSGADTALANFNPLPNPYIGPDTTLCAGENLVLDGGAGYDKYLWSTNDTVRLITVNMAGTYIVNVTDTNICTGSDTINIAYFAASSVDLGTDTTICDNTPLMLDAGAGFTGYLWQDNSTNQTYTASTAGTYAVAATDTNGCVTIDSIVIQTTASPAVNLGPDQSECQGTSLGLDAGPNGTDYLWSTGDTTQGIIVTASNTYNVSVTNAAGCSNSDTINIVFNTPPTVSLGQDTAFCEGLTVMLDAGAGYNAYDWSTGDTTQMVNVSGSGNVWVVVTDSNGCTDSDTLQTTEYAAPQPGLGPDQSTCDGDSITLYPIASGTSYAWSTGESTPTIVVYTTDSYWVVVADSNGCAGYDTTNITFTALPTPMAGADTSLCPGESTVLDGGAGYTSYMWSTGETTQMITVDTTDMYTVAVTDTNGCTGSDTVMVSIYAVTAVDLGADTTICDNTPLLLDAGSGYASYMWQNSSMNATFMVSMAGTYTVMVADSNGCPGEDSIAIQTYASPVINLGADIQFCQGDSAVLDAGAGYAAYTWNTGDSTQMLTAMMTNDYIVTVTSGDGCQGTDTVNVDVMPLPQSSFTYTQSGATFDFQNTSTAADTLFWDLGDGFFAVVQNPSHTYAMSGTYVVCLQTENGCGTNTWCDTITVTVTDVEESLANAFDIQAYPNPGTSKVAVEWNTTEAINGQLVDLSGKVIQQWSSPAGVHTRTLQTDQIPAGLYIITISTARGNKQYVKWMKTE